MPGSLVSFPESEWFRDRKLYYNYQVGHTQVGRIHVDTVTDKQAPRLVFCVFGGGEAEENSANIDCGGAGGTSNGKPLFRYEYQAAPVVTEKGR